MLNFTTQELRKMEFVFTEDELLNEEWLPIKDFEEYYEVSSLGRFRSKDKTITRVNGAKQFMKGKILKNNYYTNGYVQLILYVNKERFNFLGHRVVAEHFIPNPDNLPMVNHDNTIKWDNRKTNLGWCTGSENMIHAFENGLMANIPKARNENHPNTKLTNEDVRYIRDNYQKGKSNRELFLKFSDRISRSGFESICYGVGWKGI